VSLGANGIFDTDLEAKFVERKLTVLDSALDAERQTVLAKIRVLVVDDEPELCGLAATWLVSLGYAVTTAHDATEAIEHLSTEAFDILFTDIVMPGGMDGVELAKQAKQQQPGLRVLLASGYAQRLLEGTELPGVLLNKPYRKADLARAFSDAAT